MPVPDSLRTVGSEKPPSRRLTRTPRPSCGRATQEWCSATMPRWRWRQRGRAQVRALQALRATGPVRRRRAATHPGRPGQRAAPRRHGVQRRRLRLRRRDRAAAAPETSSAVFRRLAADAGLRPFRLHDLRHTSVTLMLAAGIPVHVVASVHGHDPLITADLRPTPARTTPSQPWRPSTGSSAAQQLSSRPVYDARPEELRQRVSITRPRYGETVESGVVAAAEGST
jgi:hypothetical protein